MSGDALPLIIGVPRETSPGERRVAVVPSSVGALKKAGLSVLVEAGAGAEAGFTDEAYRTAGAEVAANRDDVFERASIVVHVRLGGDETGIPVRSGQTLIGMSDPLSHPDRAERLAATGATVFALDLMPRTTRAQSMDVLSSMATIAGYRAVLLAASALPRLFPLMMTAAGTVTPAKVFVIGAGVAGLQAIATARRLGAVVRAYDLRPTVREQIESLGAKFVDFGLNAGAAEQSNGYARAMDDDFYRRQREAMGRVVAESDVVITTAAVPGKKAPILISAEMVRAMPPGSVIVDLAAERGGNCELTRPDETVVDSGVQIFSPTNLPSSAPYHASEMYSRNVVVFLAQIVRDGQLRIDENDEIIRATLVARGGVVVHDALQELLEASKPPSDDVYRLQPRGDSASQLP